MKICYVQLKQESNNMNITKNNYTCLRYTYSGKWINEIAIMQSNAFLSFRRYGGSLKIIVVKGLMNHRIKRIVSHFILFVHSCSPKFEASRLCHHLWVSILTIICVLNALRVHVYMCACLENKYPTIYILVQLFFCLHLCYK